MKSILLYTLSLLLLILILYSTGVQGKNDSYVKAADMMKKLHQVQRYNISLNSEMVDWNEHSEISANTTPKDIKCYVCTSCGDNTKLPNTTKCAGIRYNNRKPGPFTDCIDYAKNKKTKQVLETCVNPVRRKFNVTEKNDTMTTTKIYLGEYYTYFYKPFCTMTVNDKGVVARGCITSYYEKGPSPLDGDGNKVKIAGRCNEVPMNDALLKKGYTCYCDYSQCNSGLSKGFHWYTLIPALTLVTAFYFHS